MSRLHGQRAAPNFHFLTVKQKETTALKKENKVRTWIQYFSSFSISILYLKDMEVDLFLVV